MHLMFNLRKSNNLQKSHFGWCLIILYCCLTIEIVTPQISLSKNFGVGEEFGLCHNCLCMGICKRNCLLLSLNCLNHFLITLNHFDTDIISAVSLKNMKTLALGWYQHQVIQKFAISANLFVMDIYFLWMVIFNVLQEQCLYKNSFLLCNPNCYGKGVNCIVCCTSRHKVALCVQIFGVILLKFCL